MADSAGLLHSQSTILFLLVQTPTHIHPIRYIWSYEKMHAANRTIRHNNVESMQN